MTIAVLQENGTNTDAATSGSRVFASNVAVGSLIVVIVSRYSNGGTDVLVVGDISNTGTATLGAWSLDVQDEQDFGGAAIFQGGIFSAIVTGAGSLTATIAGAAGYYYAVAGAEYGGNYDVNRLESSNKAKTATDNTTPALSGNGASAGIGLFIGGLSTDNASPMTITPDAAFTTIYEQEASSSTLFFSAIRRLSTGGLTDQSEWTLAPNNAGWIATLVVYREIVVAPAGILMGQIWM